MRNVSGFRLRVHTLTVESSILRVGNGHCDKCFYAATFTVQNEVHILFHYQDLFVCSLRKQNSFFTRSAFSVEERKEMETMYIGSENTP